MVKSKTPSIKLTKAILGLLYFQYLTEIIEAIVIFILLGVALYFIITKWSLIKKSALEKMTNLSPSLFPLKNGGVLLDFPLQQNPSHLSNNDAYKVYEKYYKAYTVPMGSYAQITNNQMLKDMNSPCDGTTTPIDMCGGLYKKTPIQQECFRKCDGVRVNLYDSCN